MTETALLAADTIADARAVLRQRLDDGREADYLLCCILGCERAHIYTHPETALDPACKQRLASLLQRRLDGTPLAYLAGTREFFSLQFEVTPQTLIPRPETETLVEVALALAPERARILDLGTGCGAVAVALAHTRPDADVVACDNSRDALTLAKRNAARHGVTNVSFVASDWFERLPDTLFELIVANPPYVADDDPDLDPAVAVHEPNAAVFAQNDGLACLRRIIADAPARLREHGALALEHGHTQAEAVARLMHAANFCDIHCTHDLAGRPRVTAGIKQ